MGIQPWLWFVTIGVLVAILLADVVIIGRRPHEPSLKESSLFVGFYVSLAIVFGIGVLVFAGPRYGGEFFAVWITEYSLSVDNLFLFIIILSQFQVPRAYQQTALMIGIVLAMVLRGIFIAAGAAATSAWSWVFYLFGVFLVYTAVQLIRHANAEEPTGKALVQFVARHLRGTERYHGMKLTVVERGRRLITPMFVVIMALGLGNLVFALDSIPANFGLTQEPYLIWTTTVFALMGLRQLYFLIGGLLQRLVFLSYGLSAVLAFIGVKLVFHALRENSLPFVNGGEPIHAVPEIGIALSLTVIAAALAVTTIASLLYTRNRQREKAPQPAP